MSRALKHTAAIGLTVLLGAALAGCSLLPKEEEALKPPLVKPAQENYTTTKAEKGTLMKTVGGSATFESNASDIAQFKGDGGRIDKILVQAGDEVKKGDPLVQLLVDGLDLKLKEQQLALERAKYAFRQARGGDEEALKIAGLQVEIEQIKYDRLLEQFNSKQLLAQIDGEVTYAETLNEGDTVQPYQTLVIISDPKQLRLVLPVDNAGDRMEVQVGVKAEVTINQKAYEGKVVQTPSSAPQTDNEMLAAKYAKSIYIEMAQMPPEANIGKVADVRIVTQQRDNAVIIPKSGLRSYLGRNFVRIMEDGDKLREVDVEPGLATPTQVEIVKGIEEGTDIVLQ